MRIIAPTTWDTACPEYNITTILRLIDDNFHPSLSSQHNIQEFADKLKSKAHIFLEEKEHKLVGIMAAYLNRSEESYISFLSVYPDWRRKGVANTLLRAIQLEVRKINSRGINCRVNLNNVAARYMYKKADFVEIGSTFQIIEYSKIMIYWHNNEFIK